MVPSCAAFDAHDALLSKLLLFLRLLCLLQKVYNGEAPATQSRGSALADWNYIVRPGHNVAFFYEKAYRYRELE